MTEPREKETPGAALPETEATPEAVEAAVSRASDESLTAEPVVIPEFLRSEENGAAADGAAADGADLNGDGRDGNAELREAKPEERQR